MRCAVCGASGEQLCVACRDRLPRLEPPLCDRCGAPTARPVARRRECSGRRLAFPPARAAVRVDDVYTSGATAAAAASALRKAGALRVKVVTFARVVR